MGINALPPLMRPQKRKKERKLISFSFILKNLSNEILHYRKVRIYHKTQQTFSN